MHKGRLSLSKEKMTTVILSALGVGGATVIGALLCIAFGRFAQKYSKIFLAFAEGVMLAAAIIGLILPSIEQGGDYALIVTVSGIFVGAICLNIVDRFAPHLHKLVGVHAQENQTKQIDKIMLLVIALAIHNLPEGLATGVGFGMEDKTDAVLIAISIALHNIPQGVIIVSSMVGANVSKTKAFWIAVFTGLIEAVGILLGYFAVSIATAILPFGLAFAGGTMLHVVCNEMIPETHTEEHNKGVSYWLLIGFCLMLVLDVVLG